MGSANTQSTLLAESFTYSLPKDLNKAVQAAHKDWDKSKGTERLWRRDAGVRRWYMERSNTRKGSL